MHLSKRDLARLNILRKRMTAAPLFMKVVKIVAIIFVWLGLNFIYGFADYTQDYAPAPSFDYWGYYGFTALYSATFCYLLYKQERQPQFCLAWRWLCTSFLVWFCWQMYAAHYGVSINEKYISASLFYFNSLAFSVCMLWHPVGSIVRRLRDVRRIEEKDLGM